MSKTILIAIGALGGLLADLSARPAPKDIPANPSSSLREAAGELLIGVGLNDRIPYADIEATLIAMRELGVKVVISELDIDVIPRGRWWQDGGKYRDELATLNPYADGCPPEILQRQADQYGELFRLFRQYSDVIIRVAFWNLHDGQSWLNDFPWRRVNHPLLFDRQRQPKPAFHSVMAVLQETSEPERLRLSR